jgi:LysR family transcriptional activator of dmlA
VRHNCICIRQGDEAYGTWRLVRGTGSEGTGPGETVKVRGNLTTNDGEIAVNWALDGHGILMRAEWDIERYLESGRLVQVLPQYRTRRCGYLRDVSAAASAVGADSDLCRFPGRVVRAL